ncbi:MBL fold metallo-hydrolase [Thiolapillus sp.]
MTTMAGDKLAFTETDAHNWCIDTGLNRPGHTACYLLHDSGELAFIDTGTSNNVPGLLILIRELGFTPEQVRWILPTHVHLDHAGGAGALLKHCKNAVLATHHKGLPHMIDPARLQQGARDVYGREMFQRCFGSLIPAAEERCLALHDGERLSLGKRRLYFIDTPGHANHHGCFFDQESASLYTGDSFGLHYRELDHQGIPWLMATTTPVAFDPASWMKSLDKMMAMQPELACLTHFGPLRQPGNWQRQLRESIQSHADIALQEERAGVKEGRQQRLARALLEAAVTQVRQHNPDISRDHIERLLTDDIHLNSQGLDVWLARREKKRLAG